MASLLIRWILARTFCQATEDEPRVEAALAAVLPGGAVSKDRLTGQFGNPVVVLSRRLSSAEDLRAAWRRWEEAGILEGLRTDVDARIDEDGVLHFRLDKQEAAEGRIRLLRDGDAIDVQVKVKAYPAKAEEIRRVAHALFAEVV